MRVGLLSDTHGFLDDALFTYFEPCDELWHAGDVGSIEVVDSLRAFRPLRAVFGNIDGAAVRISLAEDLEWLCEGLRVYMTHIGGYLGHYDRRARQELLARKPGLFLCGHSHIPRVMRDQNLGLLHLNPGACGHNGLHEKRTAMRFAVEGDKVTNLELIELGPRGRKGQAT